MANVPNQQSGDDLVNVVLQWNAHGLRSKLSEIQLIATKLRPYVMALQETMTRIADIPRNYLGGRYKWYITPHINAHIHGAGLAVREDIPHNVVLLDTELEATAVTIQFPFKLTIVSLYLAPRNRAGTETNVSAKVEDLILQLATPFVIVGDFNAHHPSWGSHKEDIRGERLSKVFDRLGCLILNDGRPTRFDPTSGIESAIDLSIASWDVACRLSWQVDDDLYNSDHFPIYLSQAVDLPSTANRLRWNFERADWLGFGNEITKKLPRNNTVLSPSEWVTVIKEAAHKHIPKAGARNGLKSVPWWGTDVHEAIRRRRKCLRRLRRLPLDDPTRMDRLREFKLARSRSRKIVKDAKKSTWSAFTADITEKTSSGELWRKVKSVSGKGRYVDKILKLDAGYSNEPCVVAEAFADQFAKVSANSNYSDDFLRLKAIAEGEYYSSYDAGQSRIERNYNRMFELAELNWALRLGTGKAAGKDDIGYPLLRGLPLTGRKALLDTMNELWLSGHNPDEWKEGLVIPILKPGKDRSSTEGYRPITLLSCTGKTFERMVNRRLSAELERQGLINPQQHAFRCGYGAETFFSTLDHYLDKATEGLHEDVVSLDLSKAYDMTWRLPILTTLKRWKIQGRMFSYVESFLRNRKFRVLNAGAISGLRLQENGIPQGSVISVTLFLIAMNSVFERIPQDVHILVYADDITLIAYGKYGRVVRHKMQDAVVAVVDWAVDVGFTISPEKSKLLHVCFGHNHRPSLPHVTIDDLRVKTVREMKLLGVNIDNKLRFVKHTRIVKECINAKLNVLRTLSGRFSEASRRTLTKVARAIIVPSITYGAELWSRGGVPLLRILEPQYNEASRISSGAYKSSPITSLLVENGMLPLRNVVTVDMASKAMRILERSPTPNDLPSVKRAREWWFDLTETELPTLSQRPRLWQRAWDAKVPKVDWRVKRTCGAGADPKVAQAAYGEVAASYSGRLQFFTDGSLVGKEVGYGVSGFDVSCRGRLSDLCGIFSAEAYALLQACKLADGAQAVVFSDSASCLSALEQGRKGHPWLLEVLQYTNVTFVWVPGHAGIQGNEKADKLANMGRHAQLLENSVPYSDANRWLKHSSKSAWNASWYSNRTAFLRQIKESTQEWKDVPNPRDQRVLTRLRIGHTRLTHGPRFNGETALCQGCGADLDVSHLLVHCPARATERRVHGLDRPIQEVLANVRSTEDSVLKFLRETGLYDQI